MINFYPYEITPHIFFLLLIVALSFSCSKEKPDPPTYYLTQDMYDYVIFPVGSWWVYRDSATGVLDTVKVLNQERKIVPAEQPNEPTLFYYENIYQNFSKTYPNYFYEKHVNTAFNLNYTETCENILRLESFYEKPGVTVYNSNYIPGTIKKFDDINYLSYIDSIKVRNSSYSQIKKFKIQRISEYFYDTLSKYNGLYYYAKNVGLVKKGHKDSLTWELINYHINK